MAFLMCPPTYFDVDYVINPWMQGNLHQTSRELAVAQWTRLYDEVRCHAEVRLIEPRPALPDMVFTANAGLVHERRVLVSHFRCPERRGEERFFREWFTSEGFAVEQGVRETPFEGEGDALALGNLLCLGYGFRTEAAAAGMLERAFECEVLPLRLVDPRFYHLDTCFAPLPNGDVMYYPPAFDAEALRAIEARFAAERRIVVSQEDALHFACNVVAIDEVLILNQASEALQAELAGRGFRVVEVRLSEFMKAGGAAKCLVLKLG